MTGAAISATDAGIGAIVVVILAVLLYRLLRHEPLDRIVRLGLFIERKRFGDADNGDPADDDVETRQWPRRPPDDPPA